MTRRPSGILADIRGSAAAEFVLWVALLLVPLLSAVDVGVYAFNKMQLEISAQAAAQAAWHLCDTTAKLPAVTNCTGLQATMLTAAQSTSLGTGVTLAPGNPIEGYYCVSGTSLTSFGSPATVGGTPTKTAATCTGTTTPPADYIQVTVSYQYSPAFPGMSIMSLLNSTITRTAWMRLL